MTTAASSRPGRSRATKEQFFVRVVADSTPTFFDATEHLGRKMPFNKPQATCAMRATADAVAFSLLHTTKTSAPKIAEAPIAMPRGPLEVLERRARQLGKGDETTPELGADEVLVELNDTVHRLKIDRESSGLVRLEAIEDDVTFQVPRQAVRLRLYMRSPRVPRVIAVGFIGHLGKPDASETVTRAAALVLNSMCGLGAFQLLSGIEVVDVPAPPARAAVQFTRKSNDKVLFELAVRLFDGDPPQPVGAGNVKVEVDLDHANSNTGRLLYNFSPGAELAEVWPRYETIASEALAFFFREHLGDEELTAIAVDIVVGEIDAGTLGRLREAAASVPAVDFTPQRYRPVVAVAT